MIYKQTLWVLNHKYIQIIKKNSLEHLFVILSLIIWSVHCTVTVFQNDYVLRMNLEECSHSQFNCLYCILLPTESWLGEGYPSCLEVNLTQWRAYFIGLIGVIAIGQGIESGEFVFWPAVSKYIRYLLFFS